MFTNIKRQQCKSAMFQTRGQMSSNHSSNLSYEQDDSEAKDIIYYNSCKMLIHTADTYIGSFD